MSFQPSQDRRPERQRGAGERGGEERRGRQREEKKWTVGDRKRIGPVWEGGGGGGVSFQCRTEHWCGVVVLAGQWRWCWLVSGGGAGWSVEVEVTGLAGFRVCVRGGRGVCMGMGDRS